MRAMKFFPLMIKILFMKKFMKSLLVKVKGALFVSLATVLELNLVLFLFPLSVINSKMS